MQKLSTGKSGTKNWKEVDGTQEVLILYLVLMADQ